MKNLIKSIFLTAVIATTITAGYSFTANQIVHPQELEESNTLKCKHGQCHAIAKSTSVRCKHCVSNEGDRFCWQH